MEDNHHVIEPGFAEPAGIGGAVTELDYLDAIRRAGFEIRVIRDNETYRFVSDGARWATENYGVKSISLLADKK